MAYTAIANTALRSTTGDNVTTGAIDTTGADLIVIYVASIDVGAVTVTDSKSNTWITSPPTLQDNTTRGQFYYAKNPTVGAGHTFTGSSTSGFPTLLIFASSGAHLTTPFDQENGANTGSAPTFQSGSVTPSENDELVVIGVSWNGAGMSVSINGSYTITDQLDKTGTARGGALAYLIQTTAAATNPTWTFTGPGTSCVGAIASFKKAAGGGGGGSSWGGLLSTGANRLVH